MTRAIIAVILILSAVATSFAQRPRIPFSYIEKADSTGQFLIADDSLDGNWNDALFLQGDTLLLTNGLDGIRLPIISTTERPIADTALIHFNRDSTKLEFYNGSSWATIDGTAGGGDGDGIYDGSGSLSGNTTVTASTNLLDISGTAAFGLPSGTDAQKPAAGTAGRVRWNTDNTYLEVDNGTSWIDLATSADLYGSFNLSANGGATTTVGSGQTLNFNAGDGTSPSRSGRDISYALLAGSAELQDGADQSPSAAALDDYVFYNYFINITGAATSNGVLTLPTPSFDLMNMTLRVYAEDASGSFDAQITSGTDDIWEQGTNATTITVANGEVVELTPMIEDGGTYVWVVISRY